MNNGTLISAPSELAFAPHPYLKHLLLLAGLTLTLVGLIIFVCAFLAAFNPTLEGLKPAALRSQFIRQLKSAHTVSLCKLALLSLTIFRTMKKVISRDAFEWGMHRSDFINAARLLKIRSQAIFFHPIKPQNLTTCRSLGNLASSCNWYYKKSSQRVSSSKPS